MEHKLLIWFDVLLQRHLSAAGASVLSSWCSSVLRSLLLCETMDATGLKPKLIMWNFSGGACVRHCFRAVFVCLFWPQKCF